MRAAILGDPLEQRIDVGRRTVKPLRQPLALADTADLLSGQLIVEIRRLARALRPRTPRLERQFLGELRKLAFSPEQRKALVRVTAGAAAEMLAGRRPLARFLEHVEYNGRRLAKLGLERSAVVSALQVYDRLVAGEFRNLDRAEWANLRWASEQLTFCIVLTLNNAFYQVREAETATFYELFQAELESNGQRELLERSLATLARFCRADAGRLFLFDREKRTWLALGLPGGEEPRLVKSAEELLGRLSGPRLIRRRTTSERLLLDRGWRGRYASCWSIPLASGTRLAGAIQFGFRKTYEWLPRERQLLVGAAERCLLASEKLRLAEDLAAREEQVRRLAAHMLEVEERERRRISRELHDEAGQLLLYLRLRLEQAERAAPEASAVGEALAEARELAGQTVLEIRRILADLSPAVLEQLGLGAAVRQLVNRFREMHGIRAVLDMPKLRPLPKQTELVVYRLVQECCNNVARHSGASKVNLSLRAADGILRLRVEDDGVGFRLNEALARRESFGLAGMRERVALMGGRFTLESRPGRGSRVCIELPLPEEGESGPAPQRAGRSGNRAVMQ
ncbi:MAG: GAF domain-containing sensor histidine kinase [Rhodospirillales bacterium]